MKQIGIITHYYDSKNYGGVLQAYALCRFLRNHGYDAEQIQYSKDEDQNIKQRLGKIYRAICSVPKRIKYRQIYSEIRERNNKFAMFRDERIWHGKKVFSQSSLKNLAGEYQLYITGSDQVWHPNAVCDGYLLDFGVEGVKKMSYAASVAKEELTAEECARYKNAFADYLAISVREKSTVELLQPIAPIEVKWVIDPVFLLRKEEWQALIEKKSDPERYVLCYFLGDDMKERTLAKEYAERKKLKLKVMPYLNGNITAYDFGYGDESAISASPEKFVELIQNAEMIFTDSFHATAFSLLFGKQFFVFERSIQSSMGSRIESITDLFGVQDHYCNAADKMTLDYLTVTEPINYSKDFKAFEEVRKESENFLLGNVNKFVDEVM